MGLNQHDLQYASNPSIRIRTRIIVAALVGLLANWMWLFICCGIFALGEFVTMFKILASFGASSSSATEEQRAEHTGRAFGQAFIGSIAAGISVIVLASIFRLIKLGILKLI